MGRFENTAQLQSLLQTLFDRIAQTDGAVRSISKARLIIRLSITHPETAVVFNGRKDPPLVSYGATTLRPDLDIQIGADTLHRVLLRELRLREAIARGLVVPRGPIWKSFVLEDIFHAAQELYPQALREHGLDII
jgi:hypothetical protein